MSTRTETWTRDGQTATIEVQGGNTVLITYELLAQLMTDSGYQRQ